MSDKVRAAANSIVRGFNEANRLLPLAGGIPQPIESSTDHAVVLARAWLADHPEDDGEPVTKEWLESIGWTTYLIWPSIPMPKDNLLEWRGGGLWIENTPICLVKTRGAVRRLMAELSIPAGSTGGTDGE